MGSLTERASSDFTTIKEAYQKGGIVGALSVQRKEQEPKSPPPDRAKEESAKQGWLYNALRKILGLEAMEERLKR